MEKGINILYLYPDMLELYGDYGNIQVLKYRLEKRGFYCNIEKYSIGNPAPDFSSFDIVFAGGGADNEQSILANDLIQYKDNIKNAVQNGTFFLLICGAYQLFGKYYKGVDGNIIPGLDIFPYYTEAIEDRKKRCIGNIVIDVKLGDICQITTGKLDANAQVDNGIYPFFTCAEQPFKIDSFAFDTEALLISGNGANLGYINYYKGKFNAYQRTYVLDLFSENIQYIKWALKVLLPKRIAIEKSSSNTPYIVLSTLTDLRLPIPCKSKQSFIANLMQSLERKLSNQIAQYDSYNYLKQYLLRQMFI